MEHEVVAALKQMAPLKAPSPDGMPPLFYQHFWQMVNQNIINSILSWLNSSTLPHLVNHTFIALIPKIKNPEYITEYRPISLCNVLYKIFSKVLANRLKKLLPTIITEHQFAFTKDRLITNNILVAFETFYSMKKYKFGDNGFMAFKLDMTKAYNWVEWSFLENLMRKMGFCENWIGLIMVCIRTVSYSVLINGEPKGMVYPSRGIRQGDSLSLLCMEGLHGLINSAARRGDIKGFSLCREGLELTHLLFADDSLLFCRASKECETVLQILESYEQALGQKVNRNKTAILFSKAIPDSVKQAIKTALGLQEITEYEKYFGLPSLVVRRKKESFNFIKEKIWRKLHGWERKLFSQAGREVLLKSVIQAILTFTMGCFKLP